MRSIKVSKEFKRDAKKHFMSLATPEWGEVLNCLSKAIAIPEKYKDHALTGNFNGCRDCHIKPDLVLIYRIIDDNMVQLVRLNTHSEVFK